MEKIIFEQTVLEQLKSNMPKKKKMNLDPYDATYTKINLE